MRLTPAALGAPAHFSSWYPNQLEALDWALAADHRFIGLSMPPGCGKSLLAYLAAKCLDQPTVILTSRIGLAHQYAATFGEDAEIAEVHGHRNYSTKTEYRSALDAALSAKIVLTNYSFYLHLMHFGQRDFHPHLLICDEAAELFKELGNFLSLELSSLDLEHFEVHLRWPDLPPEPLPWQEWARQTVLPALQRLQADSSARGEEEQERLRQLIGGLDLFVSAGGVWVGEVQQRRCRFARVWPGDEAQRYLFRDAEKVLLLSATLRPKTLDLLRIRQEDRAFGEWPHPYPWEIRPVYWLPTIRAVEMRASDDDWAFWVRRLDQLIERRPESLGLVHTVSYRRAQMYMRRSEYADSGILLTHGTKDVTFAVERWLSDQRRPLVMVSPALTTGWDLGPVGWQAIGKLPWPDSRDPVLAARAEADKGYIPYEVMQAIVQSGGRIVRGPRWEDRGETIIIDDQWEWFGPKYAEYAPKWWRVEKRVVLP